MNFLKKMLLYVLGYFALIVYVIFWDIGRKRGMK